MVKSRTRDYGNAGHWKQSFQLGTVAMLLRMIHTIPRYVDLEAVQSRVSVMPLISLFGQKGKKRLFISTRLSAWCSLFSQWTHGKWEEIFFATVTSVGKVDCRLRIMFSLAIKISLFSEKTQSNRYGHVCMDLTKSFQENVWNRINLPHFQLSLLTLLTWSPFAQVSGFLCIHIFSS